MVSLLNQRIISYYILLSCQATYDAMIKRIEGFPVWLVVFFFCSIYGYIVFDGYLIFRTLKDKWEKATMVVLISPFILRFSLNLLAINEDRKGYDEYTSNITIDLCTWLVLAILLIIISCLRLRPKV